MSWLRKVRAWLSHGLDDEPVSLSSHIQFNPPELFELRMRRAAQSRAVDEAWQKSRRRKAEVIPFHGRAR
jgi:hypothetical protein